VLPVLSLPFFHSPVDPAVFVLDMVLVELILLRCWRFNIRFRHTAGCNVCGSPLLFCFNATTCGYRLGSSSCRREQRFVAFVVRGSHSLPDTDVAAGSPAPLFPLHLPLRVHKFYALPLPATLRLRAGSAFATARVVQRSTLPLLGLLPFTAAPLVLLLARFFCRPTFCGLCLARRCGCYCHLSLPFIYHCVVSVLSIGISVWRYRFGYLDGSGWTVQDVLLSISMTRSRGEDTHLPVLAAFCNAAVAALPWFNGTFQRWSFCLWNVIRLPAGSAGVAFTQRAGNIRTRVPFRLFFLCGISCR
jgi:hypothetical protein